MEKIISTDGTPIAYQRSGSGPPLVLVHGTLGTYGRWAPILPALEEQFTVYAIERRGRGESGDSPHYAVEREYEDIAAVVDAIGGEVTLLGHSFGGLCTLEAALRIPHLRSLIAYEPPAGLTPLEPPDFADRLRAMLDAGDREGTVLTFLREVVRMPPHELAFYRTLPVFPARVAAAHTLPREFLAAQEYRLEPERFAQLDVPTLLLLGGDSPAFFRQNIEAWHAALPNSQIAVLPGQQHVAMDTAPDLFVGEVKAFLSALG